MEDMRLSHARFVGCDYGGVSLADSWLTHAQLSGEVLDGANLDHARLMHANLTGASLVNAASCASHPRLWRMAGRE